MCHYTNVGIYFDDICPISCQVQLTIYINWKDAYIQKPNYTSKPHSGLLKWTEGCSSWKDIKIPPSLFVKSSSVDIVASLPLLLASADLNFPAEQ